MIGILLQAKDGYRLLQNCTSDLQPWRVQKNLRVLSGKEIVAKKNLEWAGKHFFKKSD